jgi:hypothetical protein
VRVRGEQGALLAEGGVDDGLLRFSSLAFRTFVQSVLLGENPYDHLELRAPFLEDGNPGVPATNTLNVLFVYDPATAAKAPGAKLTLSPGR